MCGIAAYAGNGDVKSFLLNALRDLEYRGYDSAGIAACTGNGISIAKRAGPVSALEEKVNGQLCSAISGIAHTRWATHGPPTDLNAHPHLSYDGKVAIAHNGIIENHLELRRELTSQGIEFVSDTDSETLAHLIARHMEHGSTLLEAVQATSKQVQGLAVIVATSCSESGTVVGIRIGYAGSLILGRSADAHVLASNTAAMPPEVNEVTYVGHCEAVELTRDRAIICDAHGRSVAKSWIPVHQNRRANDLGDHPHHMHREISEQAASVQGAMHGRIDFSKAAIDITELHGIPNSVERITVAGMGTSYFAAMAGAHWFERLSHIPARPEYAGELADRDPILNENDLLIAVTQSGETYDTLVAIETAQRKGAHVAVLTANLHSEATRLADTVIDIGAGVEVAVPATKTFTNTLLTLYLASLQLGSRRARLSPTHLDRHVQSIARLPMAINRTIGMEEIVARVANDHLQDVSNMLFLGRGDLFPIAMEGALKMKETAYVHAEGCSASEMKHGINALIEPGTPTVVLVPRNGNLRQKMIASIFEVQSRNGKIIAVAHHQDSEVEELADAFIPIDADEDEHVPFLMTIPLQQLAYHVAVDRGYNPDRPRNLAKTVTVA